MPKMKISQLDKFLVNLSTHVTVTDVEIGDFGFISEPGDVINFILSFGPNTTVDLTCNVMETRGARHLMVVPAKIIQITGINFRVDTLDRWIGILGCIAGARCFTVSTEVAAKYKQFQGLDVQQHIIEARNEIQRKANGW